MSDELEILSSNLAHNLIELRQRRHLTQAALAKLVGLPRSTITNIESGRGNPSLHNLAKISAALHTPIDQLLSFQRVVCSLVSADKTPFQLRGQGQVKVYNLLPDKLSNMAIERLEIQPGSYMKGTPHLAGTKEYFHCIQGEIAIKISGVEYVAKKGDTLAFPGQVAHTYVNNSKTVSIGFSVVVLAPVSV